MSILRTILDWFRGGGPAVDAADEIERPDDLGGAPEVMDLGASDTIDLHTFKPKDVPSVVREFLNVAVEAGFAQVRIIHGKGIGVQRRIVREVLSLDPRVSAFSDATDASGWGATVAYLSKPDGSSDHKDCNPLSD